MTSAGEIAFGGDADLGLIRSVAAGCRVSIVPESLAAVRRQRAKAVAALADGRLVYGVNTGMGALSSVRLTEQQQRSHQRNLLLARATGGPPWLEVPEARAVLAVRLLTFLSGDAAVSAELCQRLADLLNRGVVPAVPRQAPERRARSSSWPTRSGPSPGSAGSCGRTAPRSRRARRFASRGWPSSSSARRRASR